MARHALAVLSETDRQKAARWLARLPLGWRIEFKEHKRTNEQNDRLWELLGRVSKRMDINGARYRPDQWKCIFMKAMKRETEFLPTLDGEGFFPSGFRSSDLTIREMCDMQTFMESWCAEKGVDIWEKVE